MFVEQRFTAAIATSLSITDSHLCGCDSIENSQHFFFHCRFYEVPRAIPLSFVAIYQTPTLNIFLNGDSTL